MRNIYFVLTYTGTVLSKVIKAYTRKSYSHISIALDEDLGRMYSFGRLNPYNPFNAGFVREGIHYGTFNRFKNTEALIFSFKVSEKQYIKIEEQIKKFYVERTKYKFNLLGLFMTVFHKRIRRKYYFYCAEFVKYVLEQSEVNTNLPSVVKPEDFVKIGNIKPIYQGKLQDFLPMKSVIAV